MERLKGIEALKYMLSKRQDDLQRLYNENADQLSIDYCAYLIENLRDKIRKQLNTKKHGKDNNKQSE